MVNTSLNKTISSFIDLADMLKTYTGIDKDKLISDDEFFDRLVENDTLCIMAEEDSTSEDDMRLWIWDNLTEKVKCSIIAENGRSCWRYYLECVFVARLF